MIYTARRIAAQFYEYTPGDTFNIDATPHRVAATGSDWASDPDGSQTIDWCAAERETVSWHFDGISPALLSRVIIPAVDAR